MMLADENQDIWLQSDLYSPVMVEDAVDMALDILNGNALQEGTMLFMNIDPNLTVESAVGFPAGLRFAVKDRYYPLGRYLHEQPGTALLRALWAEGDTLLLDEPFTGMDPQTLAAAAALLRERCAGRPTLLATHDRAAIAALGWPVIELEKQ